MPVWGLLLTVFDMGICEAVITNHYDMGCILPERVIETPTPPSGDGALCGDGKRE